MLNNPSYIGLDLGTSGCRAIVIDADGQILDEQRASYPPSVKREDGSSEQQPDDWWRAAQQVLRNIALSAKQRAAALAIDGTSGTLLLCDEQGQAITPGLMYDDSRAQQQVETISRYAPAEAAVHSATSALAKLLWLQDQGLTQQASYALHQADWVGAMLTGQFGHSDENNCLKLGYDPVTRSWPEWMNDLQVPQQLLPKAHAVGKPISRISADIANNLGLPDSLELIAGTTDSNAAAMACGLRESGSAVTSLGSTLVLKLLSDKPIFAPEYGIYSHRINEQWLVGGASNTGGAVIRHFFSDAEVSQLTEEINPEQLTGLDYYPLLREGERFPVNNPQQAAKLTPKPDNPALFLQAIFEGIANIEAKGYALLEQLGAPKVQHIYSAGGGSVNTKWQAIRERLCGTKVSRAKNHEAAYGSALIAKGLKPRILSWTG